MQAWQLKSTGKIEGTLAVIDDIAEPSPGPREIVVKVAGSGLNPADYKIPELGLVGRGITTFPKTVGMDLSGTVSAAGSDISDVSVGDHVIGRLDPTLAPGTLSESVIVPQGSYSAIPKDSVDLVEAAGAPTAATTAIQSIAPYVKPGDKIFINGGSGGTGTFGIQVGKILGCHVTTTCSTAKVALCKSLGADEIIDYKTQDVVATLKASGPVYNLIVDNVGSSPPNLYSACGDFTVENASYVFVGGSVSASSAAKLAPALLLPSFMGGGKRKFVMYMAKTKKDDLDKIAEWLGSGQLKTVVDSTFEFTDVAKAFAYLKGGSSAGKVVVKVA